jgi:hypothetical protein
MGEVTFHCTLSLFKNNNLFLLTYTQILDWHEKPVQGQTLRLMLAPHQWRKKKVDKDSYRTGRLCMTSMAVTVVPVVGRLKWNDSTGFRFPPANTAHQVSGSNKKNFTIEQHALGTNAEKTTVLSCHRCLINNGFKACYSIVSVYNLATPKYARAFVHQTGLWTLKSNSVPINWQ